MKPSTYRRITTGLFLFLFLVFFLLYLLLSGGFGEDPSGGGWGNHTMELGTIELSEVHSGGFITEKMPFEASTDPGDEDFDDNVVLCRAVVHNEGSVTVKVVLDLHGTDLKDGVDHNRGLCGGMYYYSGGQDADPVSPEYGAFLARAGTALAYSREEKNLDLYLNGDYPLEFTLAPGESRNLGLFFWVDRAGVEYLTDADRAGYSVTAKLTSREARA